MSEVRLFARGGHGYKLEVDGAVVMVAVLVAALPYALNDNPTPFFSLATLFVVGWGLAIAAGVRLSPRPDLTSVWVGIAAGAAISVASMVLGLGRLTAVPAIPLFAAVSEEVFFRGGLQTVFVRLTKNPTIAIVFSAGVFALFHWLVYPGYSYSYFYPLLAGLILGAAYEVTGDLSTSMIAHVMVNALSSLGV